MAMPDEEPTRREGIAVRITPGQAIRDQHIIADASDQQRHLDDYRLGYNTILTHESIISERPLH